MQATFPFARRLFLAALALGVLSAASSLQAQDVKALRGKPSSDQILDALSPKDGEGAPPVRSGRTRGLSLRNAQQKEAAEPAQQAPAAAPAAAAAEPAQPAAAPMRVAAQPRPQARALDLEIKFQFNSDQLTADGKDVLDQLATALKSERMAGTRSVTLEGHADAKGSANYNHALSLKRAQSSRSYLVTRHGIPAAKVRAVGKGSSEPADPSNPEDEVNRRVRVIVFL